MKKDNPFILTFGRQPIKSISRIDYLYEIKENFKSDNHPTTIYMITGVRGSGKTVFMSNVTQDFRDDSNWIVVDLNPERDMLTALAAQLYDNAKVKHLFVKSEFGVSFNGLSFSIGGNRPADDPEVVVNKIVEYLSSKNKNILITIDDAVNNEHVRVFAHTFQGFMRNDYSVFLLMTGLYENISGIQDSKSLTFLSRTPKLTLRPLNLVAIKENYQNIFSISEELAAKMAKLTKGYAFAYQALGYLMWESEEKAINENLLAQYDYYLNEFVYNKLWESLTAKEKEYICKMCENASEINNKEYSAYRDKLIKRGYLESKGRGKIEFVLPRFKEFVSNIILIANA